MTARDVSSRLLLAFALAAVGCYDVPKPDCGFRCGPDQACPADYTCRLDGLCLLNGLPELHDCKTDRPTPDAYSPAVISGPMGTVDPSANVRVVFDVDVTGVTTTSFTIRASSMLVPGNVTYDPTMRAATFAAPEGLPPLASLTATLTSEISDPVSGRALMPTTLMFRTLADSTRPMVQLTDPADGATGVSVAQDISFRFTEPVITVNTTTVTLIETVTMAAIPGTVTYDGPSRTATFDPIDQLTANRNYTAQISGVTDVANNSLTPMPFTSAFQTGADTVIPAVRVVSPLADATGVAVGANIVVTFDEPVMNVTTTTFQVNAGAIAGTVTMSNGNRVATFDPTGNLPAATMIDVTLSSAIVDTSSNPLSMTAFAFTTL